MGSINMNGRIKVGPLWLSAFDRRDFSDAVVNYPLLRTIFFQPARTGRRLLAIPVDRAIQPIRNDRHARAA
jgi:hypothetical protein